MEGNEVCGKPYILNCCKRTVEMNCNVYYTDKSNYQQENAVSGKNWAEATSKLNFNWTQTGIGILIAIIATIFTIGACVGFITARCCSICCDMCCTRRNKKKYKKGTTRHKPKEEEEEESTV